MSTGVATAAGTGLQGAVQGYHKQREMARQDKAQEAQEKLQLSQAGKLDAEAETEAKRKKLIEAQAEIESNNAALSTRMQELTGQLMEAQAQNKRDEAIEIGKRIKELAASMVTSQITENQLKAKTNEERQKNVKEEEELRIQVLRSQAKKEGWLVDLSSAQHKQILANIAAQEAATGFKAKEVSLAYMDYFFRKHKWSDTKELEKWKARYQSQSQIGAEFLRGYFGLEESARRNTVEAYGIASRARTAANQSIASMMQYLVEARSAGHEFDETTLKLIRTLDERMSEPFSDAGKLTMSSAEGAVNISRMLAQFSKELPDNADPTGRLMYLERLGKQLAPFVGKMTGRGEEDFLKEWNATLQGRSAPKRSPLGKTTPTPKTDLGEGSGLYEMASTSGSARGFDPVLKPETVSGLRSLMGPPANLGKGADPDAMKPYKVAIKHNKGRGREPVAYVDTDGAKGFYSIPPAKDVLFGGRFRPRQDSSMWTTDKVSGKVSPGVVFGSTTSDESPPRRVDVTPERVYELFLDKIKKEPFHLEAIIDRQIERGVLSPKGRGKMHSRQEMSRALADHLSDFWDDYVRGENTYSTSYGEKELK
jgi:hypothetical protein